MRRRACFGKASWHLTPQLGLGALGAQAVDNLLLTREAISCVAARAGLSTSFLPKLGPSEAGSGAHCHISLFNVRARARPLHDPPRRRLPGRALQAGRRAFLDGRTWEHVRLVHALPSYGYCTLGAAVLCTSVADYAPLNQLIHAWRYCLPSD